MLRKAIYDHGLVTDGWISIDPSDSGDIEKVFKKNIHEGEKELMMAVLQDAVECVQPRLFWKSASRCEKG
jgi:hypothetical protein